MVVCTVCTNSAYGFDIIQKRLELFSAKKKAKGKKKREKRPVMYNFYKACSCKTTIYIHSSISSICQVTMPHKFGLPVLSDSFEHTLKTLRYG